MKEIIIYHFYDISLHRLWQRGYDGVKTYLYVEKIKKKSLFKRGRIKALLLFRCGKNRDVCVQAVAEGDAMKADKRRKKQKQESAVDAIFGGSDSDDGVDYNPDAPEEGVGVDAEEAEYIEGGGDDGNEEAEYVDDGPSAEMKNRKRLLAGTGTFPGLPPTPPTHHLRLYI
jgi:hypothetical protein